MHSSTAPFLRYASLFFIAALAAACGASTSSTQGTNDAAAPDERPDTGPPPLPVWPDAWSADITWSDFDRSGVKTNAWTGRVAYDWKLRAMRTEVAPPEGGVPGPPIGTAGVMLMRDGKIYFIPANGECTIEADFGAPRPDWLATSSAVRSASSDDRPRFSVDLDRFDAGLAGCFDYVLDAKGNRPMQFGGSPSCQDWPKGSYIEYADFATERPSASLFDVPAACKPPSGTGDVHGCHACHDAP
jgi:hypothetical protein